MQTRQQARRAAALAASAPAQPQQASSAPLPPPPPTPATPLNRTLSFGSSLSSLTSTSSFKSDAPPHGLHTIDEEEDASDTPRPAAIAARAFGVPRVVSRGNWRALQTPVHSQSNVYPPEVFETPRKHHRPTESELRTAVWARDVELANSNGRRALTCDGTLLVLPDPEPPEPGQGLGVGLGSPFMSPSPERKSSPFKSKLQEVKTRAIDLDIGVFIESE